MDADPALSGAIAARHLADTSRYGVVLIDSGKVKEFVSRPAQSGGSGFVSGGVYAWRASIIDKLTSRCSLEEDVMPALAASGKLAAMASENYFIDIGVPDSLARAQEEVPRQRQRAAVFLDRDGVLNHDDGYVSKRGAFRWIDGAQATVKAINDSGAFVFIVTNQAGVARGFYGENDIVALHEDLDEELAQSGAHIDDLRYCPFHEDGVVAHIPPRQRLAQACSGNDSRSFRQVAGGSRGKLSDRRQGQRLRGGYGSRYCRLQVQWRRPS